MATPMVLVLISRLLYLQAHAAQHEVMSLMSQQMTLLHWKSTLSRPSVQLRSWQDNTSPCILHLSNSSISGFIPKSLGNLTQLHSLYLHCNSLSRPPVPSELGKLVNMQSLDLSINKLTGSIPVSLTNLTDIKVISLS